MLHKKKLFKNFKAFWKFSKNLLFLLFWEFTKEFKLCTHLSFFKNFQHVDTVYGWTLNHSTLIGAPNRKRISVVRSLSFIFSSALQFLQFHLFNAFLLYDGELRFAINASSIAIKFYFPPLVVRRTTLNVDFTVKRNFLGLSDGEPSGEAYAANWLYFHCERLNSSLVEQS